MKCFACGAGELTDRTKNMIYTYKGQSIELEQPGQWCDKCEEGVLTNDDIKKTEREFEEFKAKLDGLLTPQEIRRIRKDVLHITQAEAGIIFGGGKNAFSRYERGVTRPVFAVSNLLKMLERHPEEKKFFLGNSNQAERLHKTKKSLKTVKRNNRDPRKTLKVTKPNKRHSA